MSTKTLKVCYRISLPKNSQRQSCSAITYLTNCVDIFAGDDPIPVKFGPKGTHQNSNDARFTFHTRSAVQSALQTLFIQVAAEGPEFHLVFQNVK